MKKTVSLSPYKYKRLKRKQPITMRKLTLLWLALAFCTSMAYAAPIDVNMAKNYGQNYVWHTLGQKSADLSLAYTQATEAGVDALYVY